MSGWGHILGFLAGLAVLAGPVTVAAQSGPDLARGALSRVPQALVEGVDGPIIIGVGNGDAVRWTAVNGAQAGLNPNTPHLFAARRSAAPLQAEIWETQDDDAVRAAIGLAARDWISSFEVAAGPVRLGAMEIHPDSSMRIRGALFSQGYELTDRAGVMVMYRGEDYSSNPDWQDPAHPFGGADGLANRFAIDDDRLTWATGWPALEMGLAPSGPSLATMPEVQALLAGLGRAGNLGPTASVRIWLRNGATLAITGAETGPVEGLLLSDHASRTRENAAMVLLLSPGFDVSGLDQALLDAWPILHDGGYDGTPESSVSPGDWPTVTIALTGDWGADGAATNAAYAALQSVLGLGRLGFLLNR